jgi:hypothetical protein
MRVVVPALIVLSVLYFWDNNYNNGRLLDGLDSMRRSISHSVFIRTQGPVRGQHRMRFIASPPAGEERPPSGGLFVCR